MADRRRLRDRLQIKHIVELYDTSRPPVQKAKNEGELKFSKGGWIDARAVAAWAQAKGIGLREPEGGQMIEGGQPAAVSGGGFLSDAVLQRMQQINIPGQVVANAEDAEATSKAIIGLIQAQEKQAKLLRDAGRLGDLKELQAVIDEVIALLASSAKTMPDELGASIARKRKMKTADVKAVLGDAGDYLLQVYAAAVADLAARAQAFEDEKSAEVKQRRRGQ